jgi:hypothetical protein
MPSCVCDHCWNMKHQIQQSRRCNWCFNGVQLPQLVTKSSACHQETSSQIKMYSYMWYSWQRFQNCYCSNLLLQCGQLGSSMEGVLLYLDKSRESNYVLQHHWGFINLVMLGCVVMCKWTGDSEKEVFSEQNVCQSEKSFIFMCPHRDLKRTRNRYIM